MPGRSPHPTFASAQAGSPACLSVMAGKFTKMIQRTIFSRSVIARFLKSGFLVEDDDELKNITTTGSFPWSGRAEREENVLRTFLAIEPAGGSEAPL
ncbi:hypothetical protein D3A96_07240 [Robertkochia marina]|nr:hypothetical protein D3A96_07240 [Robertkochia marina]